jgi:Flp pilus assembly protein TadB
VDNVGNSPITEAQEVTARAPYEARTRDAPTTTRRATATVSAGILSAYERFLELPVAVVLLVMWVGGVAVLGACALLAWAIISALVGMVAGTF